MLLQELLALPIFANAQVAAGAHGLSNTVESMTIMDAPDIIQYLKPQELLLTTGYAVRNSPEALLSLVDSMADVGCAGLAIKTKRFMEELPEMVLSCADERNFPIIELSLEHSLGDIANVSLSHILEKRTDELYYALNTHKKFSKMIMSGHSSEHIIDALSELIDCTVMLIDDRCKLRTHSSPFKEWQPEASLIESLGALVRDHRSHSVTESSFGEPASHPTPAIRHMREAESDMLAGTLLLQPIFTFRREGYVIAMTSNQSKPALSLIRHALEQAANAIGMELLKKHAVRERSRRYKNEFFSNLVDGLIQSEQELMKRSGHYRLLDRSIYVCAVMKRDTWFDYPSEPASSDTDDRAISSRDAHYEAIKREMAEAGCPFVLFTKNDYFCAIVSPVSDGDDVAEPNADHLSLAELLKRVTSSLYEQHGIPLSVGIGNPISQLHDISMSYREAVEALKSGYAERRSRFVQPYQEKNLHYLLRMLPPEEMRQYYEETFRGLLKLDSKERDELLRTLNIFFDTHCRLAETAKQLYVHRNTVTYRLDKCERLTGRSLRDPAESLRFQTAFAMQTFLSES